MSLFVALSPNEAREYLEAKKPAKRYFCFAAQVAYGDITSCARAIAFSGRLLSITASDALGLSINRIASGPAYVVVYEAEKELSWEVKC